MTDTSELTNLISSTMEEMKQMLQQSLERMEQVQQDYYCEKSRQKKLSQLRSASMSYLGFFSDAYIRSLKAQARALGTDVGETKLEAEQEVQDSEKVMREHAQNYQKMFLEYHQLDDPEAFCASQVKAIGEKQLENKKQFALELERKYGDAPLVDYKDEE